MTDTKITKEKGMTYFVAALDNPKARNRIPKDILPEKQRLAVFCVPHRTGDPPWTFVQLLSQKYDATKWLFVAKDGSVKSRPRKGSLKIDVIKKEILNPKVKKEV